MSSLCVDRLPFLLFHFFTFPQAGGEERTCDSRVVPAVPLSAKDLLCKGRYELRMRVRYYKVRNGCDAEGGGNFAVERLSAPAWIPNPRDHLHPLSSRHTVSTPSSTSTSLDRTHPPLPLPFPFSIPFPVPKHLIGAPCPHSSQARSVVWHVASDWRFTTRGRGLTRRMAHSLTSPSSKGRQALACKGPLQHGINVV